MRKALFLSVFALAGLVSFNASASDELGEPGQLALSADRVFGLNFFSSTVTPDGGDDVKTSGTSIGLIFNNSENPYTVPRLSLDYMVADGVSIGGSLGYIHSSSETDNGQTTVDNGSTSGFVLNPRVGYVIPVSDGLDFWIRGGITYYSLTQSPDQGDDTEINGLALGADGALVISPIVGFGFYVGPTIDFGLSGKTKIGSAEADTTMTNFGINSGLVGWF